MPKVTAATAAIKIFFMTLSTLVGWSPSGGQRGSEGLWLPSRSVERDV
jgi:hypothetical protein